MKRRDLLKQLTVLANGANIPKQLVAGGSHDKFFIGKVFVTVPRHREINEFTAQAILKEAQNLIDTQRRDHE